MPRPLVLAPSILSADFAKLGDEMIRGGAGAHTDDAAHGHVLYGGARDGLLHLVLRHAVMLAEPHSYATLGAP